MNVCPEDKNNDFVFEKLRKLWGGLGEVMVGHIIHIAFQSVSVEKMPCFWGIDGNVR